MTQTATRAPETERALAENARYAATFDRPNLELPPARKLAVLACMDARLTVEDVLGLRSGEAHIIRNAGGLATDDAIRSLVISQQLLGTEEVIVIEHTGCGMLTFEDGPVADSIAEETGTRVDLPFHAFPDLESNLTAQVEKIRAASVDQGRPGHRRRLRGRDGTPAPGRLTAHPNAGGGRYPVARPAVPVPARSVTAAARVRSRACRTASAPARPCPRPMA